MMKWKPYLEGLTSFIQWLDAFWFMRFKTNYRNVYARAMHGKDGKLTASEKRIAVTLFVGEAHEQTMKDIEPTLFEKFVQFGYVHTKHPSEVKLFTSPGYKFTRSDAVVQQFNSEVVASASEAMAPITGAAPPEARPQRQASITSFFAAQSQ